MSTRRASKRLEHLFDDVEPVSANPVPEAAQKPATITGLLGRPETAPLAVSAALPRRTTPRPRFVPQADLPAPETTVPGQISVGFRQDGDTWATLRVIGDPSASSWAAEQQLLVKQVADQLSLALENARLFQDTKLAEDALRRRNTYLAAAAEIGRLVTSALDLTTIFSRTVNLVSERFGYYHAAIFLVEETGFNIVLREATGEVGAEMKARGHSLPVNDKSIVGKVSLRGEPVVVNNTTVDPVFRPNPLLPDTRAETAIPLRIGNRIIGALDIQSTIVGAFTPDDVGVLQILADQVAIAIDNARSYEVSQQAVREMRDLDRLKTQFLANMSHELRTPLNSIIGFSRVILKGIDGPVSDLQRQDLTAIYSSGQHLLGLINDVLDIAKIEAGKMELSFEEVNLADLITSVMSTGQGLVKDKPIQLIRKVDESLPTIRADAMRIRQVMLNLLSNAAKFTEQGEIIVEAHEEPDPYGNPQVRVSVADTGPGISQPDQAKLFQAFSQVDDSPTRKTGGSGLGLAISQQLVNLHGGKIGVHSQLGEGSTFFFTVPVFRSAQNAAAAGQELRPDQPLAPAPAA